MASQSNVGEGRTGNGITLHRITFQAGENIVERTLEYCRTTIRHSFFVDRAVGTIARAELIRDDWNDILEGNFRILSLNGSYTFLDDNPGRKILLLSIKLADPQGRLSGGRVGNSLIAGGPTEIVFAEFRQRRIRRITVSSRHRDRGSTSWSQPPELGSTSGTQPLGTHSIFRPQPSEAGSTSALQPPGPSSTPALQPPGPSSTPALQPPGPSTVAPSQLLEPGSALGPQPMELGSGSGSPPPEVGSALTLQSPKPGSASPSQPPDSGSTSTSQTPELSTSDFETGVMSFKF